MFIYCKYLSSFVCLFIKATLLTLRKALMAQTPGYDYDIFISYAHNDNYILSGDKGWVTQFHELLSNWLVRQRGQRNLKIWFDESNLGGNTRVNDSIKRGIESSALFFVIHSHNYQDSEYCNQELGWFVDYNQRYRNGFRIGDESRLFNIQIQNLKYDEWSETLHDTIGFVMHDADGSDGLGFPVSATHDRSFNKHMRKVVEATERTIAALSVQAAIPSVVTIEAPIEKPKIFIANVPDTLKSFRKQLINEVGHRVTILDDLPPPFSLAEHAQQLQLTLDQAKLSIHLLDQYSGMEVIDIQDGSTYPQVQADTARKRNQRSLIWVPETLNAEDIEEPEQALWLNDIENSQRESTGFHFVRSTRQKFIDQVNQELDALLEQHTSETIPSRFLIDTHQKDQRHAFQLAGILEDRGIEVAFNQELSDPIKSLESFERTVLDVKHLIIMFGRVAPQWVGGRIRTAFKVLAEQMQHTDPNLEGMWVYMLPSCPGEQTIPKVPRLIKLTCLDNSKHDAIDENVIQELFNKPMGGR